MSKIDRSVQFILWEILSLFFILSYLELEGKIPTGDTFGGAIGVIFDLLWIMLALFSLLMGFWKLRG